MTTARGLPVWVGRALRGMTALALALAAFVIAATSGAAMGRPPVVDDQPPVAVTAPPRPDTGASPCPQAPEAARDADPGRRASACPPPVAATAVRAPHPSAAVIGPAPARRPDAALPRTSAPVASGASAPLRALPVPPPIWLLPTLSPVPQSYAAQLAPTSVLVLGFGSVALASTVMALRVLRGGR